MITHLPICGRCRTNETDIQISAIQMRDILVKFYTSLVSDNFCHV